MGLNKPVIAANGTVTETREIKKTKKKKPQKKTKGYSITIPLPGDLYNEEEIKLIDKVAATEAVNSLKEISDTTAGRFYLSDTPSLSGIFKKIAGELRQQYRLAFYSRDAAADNDALFHNISVKVDRPDVVVKARGKFRAKQL